MGRQTSIARSVVAPITRKKKASESGKLGLTLTAFSAFFSLYQLPLVKIRPEVFTDLRQNYWNVDNDDYVASFQPDPADNGEDRSNVALHSIGDMGFSGSTFYATSNQQYLVKSIPRYSEHSFFARDLLAPYAAHMKTHATSLLVRIVDFLGSPGVSLGRALRLAPSHHIVMENILYGQAAARDNWEHWDLKPTSYFYPERDIAAGMLASEATKSQLPDDFPDKVRLTREHADAFFQALEQDTQLLAMHNAVDYSLFLVRIKTERPPEAATDPDAADTEVVPLNPPAVPPGPPTWRTGIPSADGEHVFRAAVLDFFWAKHKVQPRVMTMLVKLWNVFSRQGHMSITTTPEEYRRRFLNMCRGIVEVVEEESED